MGTGAAARLSALLRGAGLARTVPVPVWLIHRSAAAEDYDILCDFTALLEGAAPGPLRRPELVVLAGRDDMHRRAFARRMRAAFADQFSRARASFAEDHAAELGARSAALRIAGRGMGKLALSVPFFLFRTHPVANLAFLALSLAGGRQALDGVGKAAMAIALGRGDRAGDLARAEPAFRQAVDRALERVEIRLHEDLCRAAAFPGAPVPPLSALDRTAWPLPPHVHAALCDPPAASY